MHSRQSSEDIMPVGRTARSTSIDLFATSDTLSGTRERSLKEAFGRLAKGAGVKETLDAASHLTSFSNQAPAQKYDGKLVWRERKVDSRAAKSRKYAAIGAAAALFMLLAYSGILTTPLALLTSSSPANACNPYVGHGKLHVDYSEPTNNFWEPTDQKCKAPRYMQKLVNGDFSGLEWMRDKTVLLYGDSIERDHLSLFCEILGREPEVVKGAHKYSAVPDTSIVSPRGDDKKKKERLSRIAFRGMQDSTLPRTCYIEELNFLVANMYHFGLDEQTFWKDLDQYHPPGSIEERFSAQVEPFLAKLRADGRNIDLVEISSNMFDLARWAKQDIEAGRSTEDPLDNERTQWYQWRLRKFLDLTRQTFPHAMKMWRAATVPEDQAAELSYFNDRFGHSPASTAPYFALNRIHQIDEIARKTLQPLRPAGSSAGSSSMVQAGATDTANHERRLRPTGKGDVVYNTWSSLVKGIAAHQLDRLHGGDLATPSAVLWGDIMLWHLQQGSVSA